MNNQNFTIDTKHMSRKQLINVGRLIAKAGELDFPIDNSMTQIGYNTTFGNVYLWCEDIPYTIFVSDFDNKIKALYSCPYDGEEVERSSVTTQKVVTRLCVLQQFYKGSIAV